MQFLGATIIAGAVFFVLNFASSVLLDGGLVRTTFSMLFEAVIQTAIFVFVFHYLHNGVARVFGWYRLDVPDGKHTFDKNPALDQARDGTVPVKEG